MLCCGGEKDTGRDLKSAQNTPSRQPMHQPYPQPQPLPLQQQQTQPLGPPPLLQNANRFPPPMTQHNNYCKDDFRKPTGISEEVFRQIETVQNRYDSSTAEAFRAVQKSGEMVVRTLDPRQFIRLASETAQKINIDTNDPESATSFVEIVKRPGQTLGLYIREGNGIDRPDGVFISRIAIDSAIYSSGCLLIGDEILAVNLVDVTRMSLDDVVIVMSIPRRLVLTTRRWRGPPRFGGMGPLGGPPRMNGDMNKLPTGVNPQVVVYKGMENSQNQLRSDYSGYRSGGDTYDGGLDSPRRDYMPYRDSRTLTWDRNPKPDRNDPKYFPVNSLPRHANNRGMNGPQMLAGTEMGREEVMQGMPPPMRELSTGYPPTSITRNGGPYAGQSNYYASSDYYPSDHESVGGRRYGRNHSAGGGNGMIEHGGGMSSEGRRYSTLQYPSRHYANSREYGSGYGRSRHPSGLEYASDTDALQSPVLSVRSARTGVAGRHMGSGAGALSRSSSLPRTFQREALLRHPELSMEMDRLASPSVLPHAIPGLTVEEPMSDTGVLSTEDAMMSGKRRGYRSPSSMSAIGGDTLGARGISSMTATTPGSYGYKELRRTPSTSAIYETLRRSKELRESLTRPSSRLSMDEKIRDSDAQYFSDSEHHLISTVGMSSNHRHDVRRMRNRTLTGLETMRLVDQLRPGSATGSRPITPSFYNDKDIGQQFIDFNPADFIKYKSECDPDSSTVRLSGLLNLHLLSGRGLRAGGRSRRIRDLYCVVEIDHIHKARTVVRSGGVNFDWDEKFELDLANNLEVEFLVYSWDPQLRHRLCYRSSLRLSALFAKGQTFQQVALRMHPAGTLYLTMRYIDLRSAYSRSASRSNRPLGIGLGGRLFGVSLESVLDRESSGFLVPLIVKRCIEEVEKRGLDIIGIYRLCGSETKKSMLRDAFEESPEIVDLSSENVPDINVITGLLKEYLRELPEPVFSSCLYQMLVDAMSVFMPDDPDGNAKLVFSILDCLPKANRNCLLAIMDHLSRVTAQCNRNKMNPQNLSICFAPVLMLDYSQGQPVSHNISEPIQILKYLIEIWPKSQGGL